MVNEAVCIWTPEKRDEIFAFSGTAWIANQSIGTLQSDGDLMDGYFKPLITEFLHIVS